MMSSIFAFLAIQIINNTSNLLVVVVFPQMRSDDVTAAMYQHLWEDGCEIKDQSSKSHDSNLRFISPLPRAMVLWHSIWAPRLISCPCWRNLLEWILCLRESLIFHQLFFKTARNRDQYSSSPVVICRAWNRSHSRSLQNEFDRAKKLLVLVSSITGEIYKLFVEKTNNNWKFSAPLGTRSGPVFDTDSVFSGRAHERMAQFGQENRARAQITHGHWRYRKSRAICARDREGIRGSSDCGEGRNKKEGEIIAFSSQASHFSVEPWCPILLFTESSEISIMFSESFSRREIHAQERWPAFRPHIRRHDRSTGQSGPDSGQGAVFIFISFNEQLCFCCCFGL